ncbi:MAG: PEP-CTERM sorting domain-containing protein [Puniceicoccaceae bacterium]
MNINKLVSLFAALGVFTAGTAHAQIVGFETDYSFLVGGYINTDPDTFADLNALVEVDFLYATPSELLLTGIDVRVTNYGPAESAITGFWLQSPAGGTVDTLAPGSPYIGSTDEWTLDTALPNSMNGPVDQLGDPDNSLYFGASSGERLDFPTPDPVGYFSFDINPDLLPFDEVAWAAQGDATNPLLFVRWQEVFGTESGKGAGGPGFEPGVPEPSEVAALAVLGLGGILFVRRRFTKKK